jgi:O-antigen/teichoic acid export membrane protein
MHYERARDRLYRFLRWSEHYTKTDMVYLASGGFWLVLGQAVSALSAFTLAIAFANLVPQETYGAYKYLTSIAAMFAIFSLPGMGVAVTRATAQGNEHVIHSATRSRILFSLLGTAVALFGSGWYLLHQNTQLALALLIIAATLPVFDTTTTYLSYLAGKRRFDLQTKYHAITQSISVAVLLAVLFVTDSLLAILLAYFIPLAVTRAILYFLTENTIPQREKGSTDKETKEYGLHLTAMSMLSTVAGQIDKILLWQFLGPAQLAIYTFAIAIPEQLKGPLKGMGDIAFTKFAAQTPEDIRRNFPFLWRKLGLYAIGLFCISVAYIVAAPFIFMLIFPQYVDSVLYSQIFALSLVTGVSSIASAILSAQKKTVVQYVITTVQPLITIALFLLLIPLYGVMGAIIAFVLSRFIATIIYLSALFTLK